MKNENGFVLVGALLLLLLLVLIGISATTSSMLELQVSGADRMHTETFFQADAGVQLAARLIEENYAVRDNGGFTNLDGNILQDPDAVIPNNRTIVIDNLTFANNTRAETDRDVPPAPTDTNRDIAFFPDGNPADTAARHTNITVAGLSSYTGGSGINFGAALPTQTVFTIRSQHIGRSQSASGIQALWRHMDGQELPLRL